MQPTTFDYNYVLLLIGKLAAATTGLGVLWKVVIGPCYRFIVKVGNIPAKLEEISKEFRTNGGATVKDSLARIELTTARGEERQKILLGLVPYAVFETDKEGHCTYVNRSYLRWTGRTEDEVLGDGWVNILAQDERERVTNEWDRAIKHKRLFEARYSIYNESTGERFPVLCRAFPMYSCLNDKTDDSPLGWFGVIYRETSEIPTKGILPS